MQQRRATPGRDRRKSGRLQRETPRDILRKLGKRMLLIADIHLQDRLISGLT